NALSFINNNNNYFYLIYLKKKSEGSLYRMIFGLFMWNVIYNDNIPFVFQQPFQSSPLDLNTPFFYMNRIAKMESSDIASYLHEIWSGHFNESAICVTWNGRWILSDIILFAQCLGGYGISKICLKFSENYQYWSVGLPDLFLYRVLENIENKEKIRYECKIVEVKSENDRLSSKQIVWINYLNKQALLDCFEITQFIITFFFSFNLILFINNNSAQCTINNEIKKNVLKCTFQLITRYRK
ncbi:hypothetical protein RFI_28243, partial [Reticulomyxa filosa]